MSRARDVATQGGLVLLNTTTIGSSVSTLTISNVFNSTYDNYKVMISGSVPSTSADTRITLVGSGTPACYGSSVYSRSIDGTIARYGDAGTSYFTAGLSAALMYLDFDLLVPFQNKMTVIHSSFTNSNGGPGGANGVYNGFDNNAISATGFTLTLSTGTYTGGTIQVYGYKKN